MHLHHASPQTALFKRKLEEEIPLMSRKKKIVMHSETASNEYSFGLDHVGSMLK